MKKVFFVQVKKYALHISYILLILILFFMPQQGESATGNQLNSGLRLVTLPKDPTPTAWETWRPVYNAKIKFIATLKGTDATESLSNLTYTFRLPRSKVSSWEGYCMNMGVETTSDADLQFYSDDQPKVNGVNYTVTNNDTLTVTFDTGVGEATLRNVEFVVRVLNFAAVGILTVGVNKRATVSPAALAIPVDNNGNDIADGWKGDKNKNGGRGYDPWADAETGPSGNSYVGDGLTLRRGSQRISSHSDSYAKSFCVELALR